MTEWGDSDWVSAVSASEAGDFGAFAERSASLGFLALVPCFLAYEWAQAQGGARHTAEALLFLAPERVLGGSVSLLVLRAVVLLIIAAIALTLCFRRHQVLLPSILRIWVEGALAGLLIGPLLALLAHTLEFTPPELGAGSGMGLVRAASLLGGAAYEEFLFRVLAYGFVYVLVVQISGFFSAPRTLARGLAEGFGLLGSALFFAASHLTVVVEWMGAGGEAFDLAIFSWRFLAGCVLGALFRWRGVGVAACAHASYNWILMLGV